jgi:Kef-type K+ transport system membrane component KefB
MPSRRSVAGFVAYNAMLVTAVVGFLVIRHFGESLRGPIGAPSTGALMAEGPGAAVIHGSNATLLHLLLALLAVIASARLLGAIFRRIHQPPVIGEVVAGILLGPSLLGRIAPDAEAYLLPHNVAPLLGGISQVGIILYMFLVGVELDLGLLARRGREMVAVAHASMVTPFLLGSALALFLYPTLSTPDVSFTVFALFIGVAMAITAFPVLARILKDTGLTRTPLGSLAIASAAAGDATAWCLLAFVVGVAQARLSSAFLTTGLMVLYVAIMVGLFAPFARRLDARRIAGDEMEADEVGLIFTGLLVSALLTEYIGVHAIFGAFAFGAVLPHEGRIARGMSRRLEDLVASLLLPAFFAITGLRTQLGLVDGWVNWLWCGAIILVASFGKFGGTFLAARAGGMPTDEAAKLGVLMNTRGLMELIVLNVGLDLKVISPTLFAMMVVMALLTTLATSPLLHVLSQRGRATAPGAPGVLDGPRGA